MQTDRVKTAIRTQVKNRWKLCTEAEKEAMNHAATEKILEHPDLSKAKRVFLYSPLKNLEISCFDPLPKKFPEKEFYFPKIYPKTHTLEFFRASDFSELIPSEDGWNIPEPREQEPGIPDSNSLLFVPAMAADRKLNRLGKGKGFYDRFFARNPLGKRLCILPFFAVYNEIPCDRFDQKIHELLII